MTATWKTNAEAFAALDEGEGWPFARLVACSVEKTTAGRPPKIGAHAPISGKASAREFAEAAGTSHDRVVRYLEAWQEAAAEGLVTNADELNPGDAVQLTDPDVPWMVRKGPNRGQGFYDKFLRKRGEAGERTTGGRPRATVTEIASRVKRDPEYAETLAEVVNEAAPSSVLRAQEKARQKWEREHHSTPPPKPGPDSGSTWDLMDALVELSAKTRRAVELAYHTETGRLTDEARELMVDYLTGIRERATLIEQLLSGGVTDEEIQHWMEEGTK